MKLNFKKTILMVFNNGKQMDFMPEFEIDENGIEVVEEIRVLGLIVRSDLKWSSNTEHITIKGFHRLWELRRLKNLGADKLRLVDVYIKQVRSVLEIAVPAWHPGLTCGDKVDIERVQRANFSKKAVKHPKFTKTTITRQLQPKFCPVVAETRIFEKSPLCYLTTLLNKYSKSKCHAVCFAVTYLFASHHSRK